MDAVPLRSQSEDQQQISTQNYVATTERSAPVWRLLLSRGTLIIVVLAILLMALAIVFLPQLPDQLRDEPAAASRWFLATAASVGAFGPLLNSVGLFDVLHSLLFRLSLALLTLILAAHFADQVGNAFAILSLRRRLCALPQEALGAVCIAASRALRGHRFSTDREPVDIQDRTQAWLRERYDTVETCRSTSDNEVEYRNLALRNTLSYYLRPLLPLGMLVALVIVWVFLYLGWEFRSPLMAPGHTVRSPSHDAAVTYSPPVGQGPGSLSIQIGERTVTETAGSGFRTRLGNNWIAVRDGESALLVRVANGQPLLAEPGQSEWTDKAGVVLSAPGSEEFLLIPSLSWGLRIVRRTDEPSAFFVELYRGTDLRPQERVDVDGPSTATVTSGDTSVEIELVPLPAVQVSIRHVPARWLSWIAVGLMVVGFIGILMPPAMMVTQVGAWPADRAVVTLRSSERDDLEEMIQEQQTQSEPDEGTNEASRTSIEADSGQSFEEVSSSAGDGERMR